MVTGLALGAAGASAAVGARPPARVPGVGPTAVRAAESPTRAVAPGGGLDWQPVGRSVLGRPVMYRSSSGGVDLAWLDPTLLFPTFVGGTGDPGGPWPWGGMIPTEQRGHQF